MQKEIRIDKIIPCLPSQHGFLVDSDAGNSDVYRQQITVLVESTANLSPDRAADSIRKIHEKSEILRTVFDWSTGKELQIVLDGIAPRISYFSGDIEKLKEAAATELVQLDTIQDEPPIRFLIATVDERLYLTVTYHHILLDGPSIMMLLDSIISSDYEKIVGDSTTGYLQWMNDNITNQDVQFWKHVLAALPNEDVDVFGDARYDSAEHSVEQTLGEETASALLDMAKRYKVSAATLVQAICSEWLVKYFNKPLVYGSVLSTREFGVNDNQLGPFINTVPVQVSHDKATNLEDMAEYLREQSLGMAKSKHVPLREVAALMPSRSLYFDIILTITTNPVQGDRGLYRTIWTRENTGFPLSIDISVTKSIGLAFTSTLNQEDFNIANAIESLVAYCHERIRNQEGPISVETYTPRRVKKTSRTTIGMGLLVEQVARVLNTNTESINPEKSFLLNGGDSILALKLKHRLASEGFSVAVGQIIRTDSLLELVEETLFDKAIDATSAPSESHRQHVPGPIAHILGAYRNGHGYDYHEQAAFCLKGNLSIDVFGKAVAELGEKVSSLNLVYSLDEEFTLEYSRHRGIEVHHINDKQTDFNAFVDDVSKRDLQRAFSPSSGSLLRIYVYSADDEWYLFMSFSALVTDGWSFSTLLESLFILYSNLLNGGQAKLATDNFQSALAHMPSGGAEDLPQKSPVDDSIVSHTFMLDMDEGDMILKASERGRVTPSQHFEKVIISLAEQLAMKTVLVYESGRDLTVDVVSTVGPFSYLRQVDASPVSNSASNGDLYYVYENYPRESEDRLRGDRVGEFNERGVWRRPLLPPTATIGVLVDIVDGVYSINILTRKEGGGDDEGQPIDKKANEIVEIIRKRLFDE